MTDTKVDPLLPCPFCGKPGAICCLEDEPGDPIGFWVRCSCGIETNERRTEDEARVLWNARAAPQPSAEPLREALKPFAALAEHVSEKHHDSRPIIYAFDGALTTRLTVGDLRLAKAALAAPQPAAPLGGREAIARLIRKALVENWRDAHDGRKWDEDVLLTGCRKIGGGMGYQKPEEAAQRLALDAADAILAAIPQERGVDSEDDPGTYDEGITYAIVQLAELTGSKDWQIRDGSEDHATDVQDTIMDVLKCAGLYDDETGKLATIAPTTANAVAGTERAAIIEECVRAAESVEMGRKWSDDPDMQNQGYYTEGEILVEIVDAIRALGKETGR